VEIPVVAAGCEVARLILTGDPQVAVTIEERVIALALADQLGIAVAMATPGDLQRVAESESGSG